MTRTRASLFGVRRTVRLAAVPAAIAASVNGCPAGAQGCFGPPVPTVSPADAVAIARACGGGDGGIAVALALQSDRFAEWSARRDGGAEPGGSEGWWLRVLGSRRDGSGKVLAADLPRLRAAGKAVRDDLAVQRHADHALVDAILANACAGRDLAAARARAAAIVRRPMLFESSGVLVTDPLQFLECDPAVVARLVSLGGGEALVAAGHSVEQALVARQLAAVDRTLLAALDNTNPMDDAEVEAAGASAWSTFGRAAQSIGAVDPAAGAWLRLRAALDRASARPSRVPTEGEIEARIGPVPLEDDGGGALERHNARRTALVEDAPVQRRRLERAASRMSAALESVVTQPPTPEILELGSRLVPDSSAMASALDLEALLDPADVDRLTERAAAAAAEVLAAVPSPRQFAIRPKEVYRLASWVMEPWLSAPTRVAEGCDCEPSAWLETGWPTHAALVCVDVGAIAGCAAVDRAPHCRAIAALNAERAAIPLGNGDPEAVEQLRDFVRRARQAMFAALRASIAALPPADSQPEQRAAALRAWCLSAIPGLRQLHDDAVRDIRAAAPQDADARIASMGRALSGAMERILAIPSGSTAQDASSTVRAVLGSRAALRAAANAIEQASASVAPPPSGDDPESLGARLRDEQP